MWAKAGFDPVVAPLLTVEGLPTKLHIPGDAALIFTSAHGVRYCGLSGDDRRVYCVGDATARVAKAHGFTSVISAQGDWRRLTKIIDKKDQSIIHISGSIVRGQIVQTLRSQGLNAQRQIVYRTDAVTQWPLDESQIDAVALYSPMAAEILMALPSRQTSHLTAYCLSANVAAPLQGMTVRIAASPNERALIACSQTPES